MSKNRNYNYSDVDMALAAKTIAGNFKINLSELSTLRTNWTAEYADDLESRIDSAIENHLGIDPKKELRDATNTLTGIITPAKRDLSAFKIQVDEDFKNDASKQKEILKNLGFTKNLRAIQKGDQEALIELLYTFKTNMIDTLKQEITDKGMNPALIENLIGYADAVKTANVTQESLKETTKDISLEVANVFNAIYDEIIGICKIASNYYQYEPIKKEQFTFSKVISNMNASRKATPLE
jgi:hypothetical protein